jgi:hypothetical protein
MKTCQWCDSSFESSISYQIYCSSACRDEATKEKIAKKYEKVRRNRMMKNPRKCKSCGNSLSAYNDDQICNACAVNPSDVSKTLKEIRDIANGKSELD